MRELDRNALKQSFLPGTVLRAKVDSDVIGRSNGVTGANVLT